MIYAYEIYKTEGPYGTTLRHVEPTVEEGEAGVIVIGEIEGTTFVHVPETVSLPAQPEEINFRAVELTEQQKEELKKQAMVMLKKDVLRKHIEKDVGDIHDLVADCMKLIEFNLLLTSRIAADYFGTDVMDDQTKQVYAQRNQTFLDSVNQGNVTLRGSFEDANEMLVKLMTRYSHIQDMVKAEYIDHLNEIGL